MDEGGEATQTHIISTSTQTFKNQERKKENGKSLLSAANVSNQRTIKKKNFSFMHE